MEMRTIYDSATQLLLDESEQILQTIKAKLLVHLVQYLKKLWIQNYLAFRKK